MPRVSSFDKINPIIIKNTRLSFTCGRYRISWGFRGRGDSSKLGKLWIRGRDLWLCMYRNEEEFQNDSWVCPMGVQGTLSNTNTILFRRWGYMMSRLPMSVCMWYWNSERYFRRVARRGRLRPRVRSNADLLILLIGFTSFGSLFGSDFWRGCLS